LIEHYRKKEECKDNASQEFKLKLVKEDGNDNEQMDEKPAFQVRDKLLISDIFVRQIHNPVCY